MHDTLVEDVKGCVEAITFDKDNVLVKGWAFSETRGVCPVRYQYDGTIRGMDMETRQDISVMFGKSNLILSGWKFEAPRNKYIDLQIKLGSEWKTYLNCHTFEKETTVREEEYRYQVPVESKTVRFSESLESTKVIEPVEKIHSLLNQFDLYESSENEIIYPSKPDSLNQKNLEKFIDESLQDFMKKNPQANPSNTTVSVIRFNTNPVHLSSFYVIDHFYQHPEDIRQLGLSQQTNPSSKNFVRDIPGFQKHFEKIIGVPLGSFSKYVENGQFLLTTSNDFIPVGTKPYRFGGMLFLTPDAPVHSGITFYRMKNNTSTEMEVVDTIGNIYNRLVIFDTRMIHGISLQFGDDLMNGRLVQLFAFDLA